MVATQIKSLKIALGSFFFDNKVFVGLAGFTAVLFLEIPVSIVFLLMLVLGISSFIPSQYVLQKIAISSVLIVGLTPFYLLCRGVFTDATLNRSDLFLFGTIAFFLAYASKRISRTQEENNNSVRGVIFSKSQIFSGLFGLIVGVLFERYLLGKSLGYGLAWISSGDSKNHLVAGVDLVRYGDLLPSTFLTQPINLPSTLSLLLAQIGSDLADNPSLLGEMMETYAYLWVVLIGFTGLAFSASFQVISRKKNFSKGISTFLSLTPIFSLILGPALHDGFFTAVFGVATLTVITNWFLEIQQLEKKSNSLLVIGFLIFLATLMSWMFIIAVTFPILLMGVRSYLNRFTNLESKLNLVFISLFAFVIGTLHLTEFGQSFTQSIKVVLSASGAITVTKPSLYIACILIIFLLGMLFKLQNPRENTLLILGFLHLTSLIIFREFSNLGLFSWNYYLLKYQWIMVASLFGIIFAYVFSVLENKLKESRVQMTAAILLNFLAFFFISESVTPEPVNRVVIKVFNGWENPRWSIMDLALKQELSVNNPTMFFRTGYAGDSRMANFWMNALLAPQDPVRGWNYTIDTNGDVKQLCDVNAYYPSVKVVTSDVKLEEEINLSCPGEEFQIEFISPVF